MKRAFGVSDTASDLSTINIHCVPKKETNSTFYVTLTYSNATS